MLTWKDIDRIRAKCQLPLVLKGIASPEVTPLAVERGADVVYVSNHGGRQPDHAQGTLDVLSEIIEEPFLISQSHLFRASH